jgi:gliding motility-associated-like protein
VPNIFSPNGDGNNDEFFIQSRGYIDLKVTIFNRWGNIINSFDGVLGNWDGKDSSGNEVSYDAQTVASWVDPKKYQLDRMNEYPPITDYIDGVVKGDQSQIDAYIAACQAVKAKYPKP